MCTCNFFLKNCITKIQLFFMTPVRNCQLAVTSSSPGIFTTHKQQKQFLCRYRFSFLLEIQCFFLKIEMFPCTGLNIKQSSVGDIHWRKMIQNLNGYVSIILTSASLFPHRHGLPMVALSQKDACFAEHMYTKHKYDHV